MSNPREIKSSANGVSSDRREAANNNQRIDVEIGTIKRWWCGKAGDAFLKRSNELKNDVREVLRDIDQIESELQRLASSVERADIEREAEAKRRREAQKKVYYYNHQSIRYYQDWNQ